MSEWSKAGNGVWEHTKSGATVHKTSNPHAWRVWYVSPSDGGAVGARAFAAGAAGGFFRLAVAKAAIETAFAAAR